MKRGRAMWFGFALGVLPIPLGFIVPVPVFHGLVDILTTPGVLVTLPFHNAMPGGGWGVMALIGVANGLVYGLVAWYVWRRRDGCVRAALPRWPGVRTGSGAAPGWISI